MINKHQELFNHDEYKKLPFKKWMALFYVNFHDAYKLFYFKNDNLYMNFRAENKSVQWTRIYLVFTRKILDCIFCLGAGFLIAHMFLLALNLGDVILYLITFAILTSGLYSLNYFKNLTKFSLLIPIGTVVGILVRELLMPYSNLIWIGTTALYIQANWILCNKLLTWFLVYYFAKDDKAFFENTIGQLIQLKYSNFLKARTQYPLPSEAMINRNIATDLAMEANKYTSRKDDLKGEGFHKKAKEILLKIWKENKDDVNLGWELSVLYNKSGEQQYQSGEIEDAVIHYEHYLEVMKHISKNDPDNIKVAEQLVFANWKLGDIFTTKKDLYKAEEYFQMAKEVLLNVLEKVPEDSWITHDFSVVFLSLGDCKRALGDIQTAYNYYESFFEKREELYHKEPDNRESLDGYIFACKEMGDLFLEISQANKAMPYYSKASDILGDHWRKNKEDTTLANELSNICYKLGECDLLLDNLKSAGVYFKTFLEIKEWLWERMPENGALIKEVIFACNKLGDYYKLVGDEWNAEACYRKVEKIE